MSATNRGRERQKADFYPTPEWAIRGLKRNLNLVELAGFTRVYDPCCGDGRILKILGEGIASSRRRTWYEADLPVDYLERGPGYRLGGFLVTNPPFSLAEAIVRTAFERDKALAVCLLLRVNFLGGIKRLPFWSCHGQPKQLMPLVPRPCFVHVCMGNRREKRRGCGYTVHPEHATKVCPECGGTVTAGSDACEYAWFYWGDDFLLANHRAFIVPCVREDLIA